MSIAHRFATGSEILQFYLNHGWVMRDHNQSAILLSNREDTEIREPVNISCLYQNVSHPYLEYALKRGGFTVEQFWAETTE
jgi:hypothetical protein